MSEAGLSIEVVCVNEAGLRLETIEEMLRLSLAQREALLSTEVSDE